MRFKIALAALFGLVLSSCSQPATQSEQISKELPFRMDRTVVEYDRFKDKTRIYSAAGQVSDRLLLAFLYDCDGHSTECDPGFITVAFSINAGPTRSLYSDSHELIFLADGVRIIPAFGDRVSLWGPIGNGIETVVTSLKPDDFLKLIHSHSVDGRLGPTEFTVQESDLEKWRTFAAGVQSGKNSKRERIP